MLDGDERRQDISASLSELDSKDPHEQAIFWKSCVKQQQPELSEIGGLPLDAVANDVLTRYFDSSTRGIRRVYRCAVRDQVGKQDSLYKEGLYDALSEHLSFLPILTSDEREKVIKNGSDECFESICKVVGIPCSVESFAHAVRRLRIALLLEHFSLKDLEVSGKVFHVDYDDDVIHTPFTKSATKREVHHAMKKFRVPVVEDQVPIENYENYLFVSKMRRRGRVHWSHLHFPKTELILAVGQVWRLPGPALAMMCELGKAQPQIEYNDPSERSRDDEDGLGYSWSYIALPAVYLDITSRQNLDLWRRWFGRRQDPKLRNSVDPNPPRVHVACTNMTLGMMWSSNKANCLLTAETEPYYIGKWTTDADHHKPSAFKTFLDKITCKGSGLCCSGLCLRRNKPQSSDKGDGKGDYQKLPTEDPDDNDLEAARSTCSSPRGKKCVIAGIEVPQSLYEVLNTEDEGSSHRTGEKATDEDEACITFEKTFEPVLSVLEKQNSLLRLGDHWHLLTRIVLNRTAEYMDVLEVYEAAITRLGYLIHEASTSNKDSLISKIETVKLELNSLQRLVQPFADFVVPDLLALAQTIQADYPIVFHHVKDTENNIRAFMPKCTSLISRCEHLTIEYDRIAGDKMNNILNILTFITFVITPMQIMTGLYGMNFKIIPELRWDYGYHYFWGLSLTLTFTFALILVCLRRAS